MPTSRRRWYQFKLSTLLIVVTLLALPCGYFAMKVEQARRQHIAIETIRGLGGSVHYDYEVAPGGFTLVLASPPGPPWLQKLLGVDFFASAAMVDFPDPWKDADLQTRWNARLPESLRLENNRATEICWQQLQNLPHVKNLYLNQAQVADGQFRYIESLTELEKLWLNGSTVGDADLAHLINLPHLEYLMLINTQVSDAGLKQLQQMRQLRELSLYGTKVTRAGQAMLQRQLPDCEIDQ